MTAAVREVWGGSLCISTTERSQAELQEIRRNLPEIPGVTTVSVDGISGQVDVGVVLATEALQRRLDEEFGEGAVRLWGTLEPIDL